jgi:hypothetical protein
MDRVKVRRPIPLTKKPSGIFGEVLLLAVEYCNAKSCPAFPVVTNGKQKKTKGKNKKE